MKKKATGKKISPPRRRKSALGLSENLLIPNVSHSLPFVKQLQPSSDLPFSYGQTKLILLVRDPYWAFSYWDFSAQSWNWAQSKLSEDSSLKPLMRIYDLDLNRFYDLLISLEARNWYLHLGVPDHRYAVEIGIGDGVCQFHLIARSNEVRTPRDGPSAVVDPQWSDRDFEEIYRRSVGRGGGLSSPSSPFSAGPG